MSPTLGCPLGLPWVPAGSCCHMAAQISLPQQVQVHLCAAFPSCNLKTALSWHQQNAPPWRGVRFVWARMGHLGSSHWHMLPLPSPAWCKPVASRASDPIPAVP